MSTDEAGQQPYDCDDTYDRRELFRSVRRFVVKVGTRILSSYDNLLDDEYIGHLIEQIAQARNDGLEAAIVSSGAVGAGMGSMGLTARPRALDTLQALAAIGQSVLMHRYKQAAGAHGIRVGQVLLTAGDLNRKTDYMHVQNALRALFRLGALPVVNENDSVAVEELRFGDNDSLSANVANLIGADLLIILTDTDGLFEGSPDLTPKPPLIRTIRTIDRRVEELCGDSGSETGIGGMGTKVQAARTAAAAGVPTVIAHGRKTTLQQIIAGESVGTLVLPQTDTARGHRRWILARKVSAVVFVDDGAANALMNRRTSLLPSGITRVRGSFKPGDAVSIHRQDGGEIARGLAAYSSGDVRKLAGHHTREITALLGYNAGDEIVHRDNMVITANGNA